MLISKLCNQSDFRTPWLENARNSLHEPLTYHRKLWEYCFIYHSLFERGILQPNKKGLGFGAGREPLASLFASHGCEIVATDRQIEGDRMSRSENERNFFSRAASLNERGLCEKEKFFNLVKLELCDGPDIPTAYTNQFDFTWSSGFVQNMCSVEKVVKFISDQMKCLRSGGIAVHTTEFNISSNEDSIDNSPILLFRKKDIDYIINTVRKAGHYIRIDYTLGDEEFDVYVDQYPYKTEPHLKLQINQYVCTSIGLIFEKTEIEQ